MQTESGSATATRLVRGVVAKRRAVYVGGMVVISLPLLAATAFGIELSGPARVAVVVPTLTLMSLAYLGERRLDVGRDGTPDPTAPAPGYSLGSQLSIAAAVVGFAIGVYVSITGDPRAGAIYLFGSLLYGYREYRKQLVSENDGRSRR